MFSNFNVGEKLVLYKSLSKYNDLQAMLEDDVKQHKNYFLTMYDLNTDILGDHTNEYVYHLFLLDCNVIFNKHLKVSIHNNSGKFRSFSCSYIKTSSIKKRYMKLNAFERKLVNIKNEFAKILVLFHKGYKLYYNKYNEVVIKDINNNTCYYEIFYRNDRYYIKFMLPNIMYEQQKDVKSYLKLVNTYYVEHGVNMLGSLIYYKIIDDYIIEKLINKYFTEKEFLENTNILLPNLLKIVYSYLILNYLEI